MSFDLYQTIVDASNQFGVPPAYSLALAQQENNFQWRTGDGGAAIGFFQLHAGAAADTGYNRFDPVGNVYGGVAYLKQQYNKYGNWTDAFDAYNQGHFDNAGLNYAASVWNNVKKFTGNVSKGTSDLVNHPSDFAERLAITGANAILPGSGQVISGVTGIGGDSWFTQFKDWITNSGFFERLALAFVGLIFILGVVYTLKGK